MEGTLLVPPERGTIIGRALWKVRYPDTPFFAPSLALTTVKARFVVVGGSQREQQTNPTSASHGYAGHNSTMRIQQGNQFDSTYLSIYKSKVGALSTAQLPYPGHDGQS